MLTYNKCKRIVIICICRQVGIRCGTRTDANHAFGANLEGGEADGGDGCFSFATDSLNTDCVLGVGGQVSEGECEAGGGTEHRIVGHIIYGIVVGVAVPGDGGTVGGDIGGYKVGSRSAAGQCGEGCADGERGVAAGEAVRRDAEDDEEDAGDAGHRP